MNESEFLYKFIIIGDQSVGKTSILSRFISNNFTDFYHETIGVDFLIKHVTFNDRKLKCQFWDASGSEKYRSIVSAYFKGANGILAVYDITSRASFESLKTQLNCYKNHVFTDTSIVVIGNKADLSEKREVLETELDEFANANGFNSMEISAKTNVNLNDCILNLVKQTFYRNDSNTITKLAPIVQESTTLKTISLPKINAYTHELEHTNTTLTNVTAYPDNSQQFASRSEFLNANSNSFLIGSNSFIQKDQNKKIIADLVEQVSTLKTDNERKDALIKELSCIDEFDRNKSNESSKLEDMVSNEQASCDYLRKELRLTTSRYDAASIELNEAKEKNILKDSQIYELKSQVERLKNEHETYEAQLSDHRSKIINLGADLSSYEIVGEKSQLTINSLQANNNELIEKITKLESDIGAMRVNLEESEAYRTSYHEQLKTLNLHISHHLGIDTSDLSQFETLVKEKVEKLTGEVKESKTNEKFIHEKIITVETENKVHSEIVERLVSDLNNRETEILSLKQDCESARINITSERDSAIKLKLKAEEELSAFKASHLFCTEDLESSKKEVESLKSKTIEQEHQIFKINNEMLTFRNKFISFKEDISKLLSESQIVVESDETKIKESIEYLMISSKDRGIMISSLECKIEELTSKLESEYNIRTETAGSNQANQSRILEMESSIRTLQNNLNATITARDQLNTERSLFNEFYLTLANTLQASHSFDKSNQNKLIKKVTELLAIESDSTRIQNKLNSVDFEKKIQVLEEELTNKELHLNLLRSKIVDLEEGTIGKVYGKSELKTEHNNAIMENKKQKVKIEKLTKEYNDIKAENISLKAHTLDIKSICSDSSEKDSILHEYSHKINELSCMNDKRLVMISELKEENENLESDFKKATDSSFEVIQNLSEELRDLKQELIRTNSREKQLLEFRDIVSKKLGLNITGQLGEYEYVASIENALSSANTIHLQQAHSTILSDGPPSSRACKVCPSWSACSKCMAFCACTCACAMSSAMPSPRNQKSSMSKKYYYNACNNNNNNEGSFHYE